MQDLSGDMVGKEEFKGRVLGIPGSIVDSLRAVEAFKTTQAWGLFRRPGVLVRNETVEMGKMMEEVGRRGKTVRRVLVGERGSGKSLLALQAMIIGFLKRWTVINIPEGISSPSLTFFDLFGHSHFSVLHAGSTYILTLRHHKN